MSRNLFLGWDVGAWHCDRNKKSRDALCVLEDRAGEPVLIGTPWRANLRETLKQHEGRGLIEKLLSLVEVPASEPWNLTIAIDATLAWPKSMLDLLATGATAQISDNFTQNPYLFRHQETVLRGFGYRPLSSVQDQIGSQSTKAIHFLRRAGLLASSPGVWTSGAVTAIEAYPAPTKTVSRLYKTGMDLLDRWLVGKKRRGEAWREDVGDAVVCALVARLHRLEPEELVAPGAGDGAEGWIWLPKGTTPPAQETSREVADTY